MSRLKKHVSDSLGKARAELANMWASYQPISPEHAEASYRNDIQQIIKEIEDSSRTDIEAWEKFKFQNLSDELKLKLKDFKIGPNENSVLHLAAKNCRKLFCSYLINEIKIGKFE
jgi:uncharacterized protein with von Willebrand factor type A (vWA) domain